MTAAINQAPDGAIIAGSEEAVRDAMARFRPRVYELGVQLRTDVAKVAFPPSGPGSQPSDDQGDGRGHTSGLRGGGRGHVGAGLDVFGFFRLTHATRGV